MSNGEPFSFYSGLVNNSSYYSSPYSTPYPQYVDDSYYGEIVLPPSSTTISFTSIPSSATADLLLNSSVAPESPDLLRKYNFLVEVDKFTEEQNDQLNYYLKSVEKTEPEVGPRKIILTHKLDLSNISVMSSGEHPSLPLPTELPESFWLNITLLTTKGEPALIEKNLVEVSDQFIDDLDFEVSDCATVVTMLSVVKTLFEKP